MDKQKQRIKIAEDCGYENVEFQGDDKMCGVWSDHGWIPDYLNDLNAMHEAEEWLKHDDPHVFACYLSDLFEAHGCDAIHLAAAPRAEAFLRTLDLWEE